MTPDTLGLNPLLAIIVVVPIMAAIGYGLQRGLLNRTLGDDVLPPLLAFVVAAGCSRGSFGSTLNGTLDWDRLCPLQQVTFARLRA